ncbi:MAG: hypothetical protein ACK56F_11595 [bacterium]
MPRGVLFVEARQFVTGEVDEAVGRAAGVIGGVGGAELKSPVRAVAVLGEAAVLVGGRCLDAVHAKERTQVELADLRLDSGEPGAGRGEDGAAAG